MSDLSFALDAEHAGTRVQPDGVDGLQDGFQLPGWIWQAMICAYAVFFLAITAATGRDGHAVFVIVISACFAAVYFGLASVLGAVKGRERPSPLSRRGGVLQTCYGPMDRGAVAAQILTVPACIAFFAVAILVIRSVTGG